MASHFLRGSISVTSVAVVLTLAALLGLALLLRGLSLVLEDATIQRSIITEGRSEEFGDRAQDRRWQSWANAFARTRWGRSIQAELELAGLNFSALTVAVVTAVLALVVPVILWRALAPVIAIGFAASAWLIVRWWLRRAQQRRRSAFVSQIPELARILSNATGAGLSISTAWQVAAGEMPEPTRTEVNRIVSAVRFGRSLEDAMIDAMERMPSREVRVLMSTLVIASRSGGALVHALQDISLTLDSRKEIRREVRTIFSQAVATGYTVIGMGLVVVLGMNFANPGLLREMTESVLGQVGIVIAVVLFAVGLYIIRRITKVDL